MIKFLSNKHNLIFLLLYSLPVFIFSQINTFQTIIGGTADESYPRIINAGNNEYLILNRTLSNSFGNIDIMLTKIDSAGKLIWTKNIGNSGRNYSKTIHKTDDGFIILTWNAEYGNIDDWCLIKLDKDGEIIEHKYFGTLEIDEEVHYLIPMLNGEYIIGSCIREYSTNSKFSVMDNNLNVYNSKTYLLDGSDQIIRCVIRDDQENILFCGYHNRKPLLQGIDKNGNLIFMKYLDLAGTSEFRDITLSTDGSFIVAGFTNGSGSGDYDILLTKVNTEGLVSWIKTIGLSGNDKAFDIKMKPDGTFLITGETSSYSNNKDIFLINIDSDGNFINGHIYGGENDEHFGFFDFTDDDGVIIVAETESFNTGSKDIFVIKTKEDGTSCCSKRIHDIQVSNIQASIYSLYPIVVSDNIQEYTSPLMNKVWQPEYQYICYDPLELKGPTEMCKFIENVKYITEPQIYPGFYSWVVPEDAEIVTNLYDTAVWINFGEIPGYIYIRSDYCNRKNIDSLYINLTGPDPFLGNDTVICSNESIILTTEKEYVSYLWQNGSEEAYYIADSSGTYWVEVSNGEDCLGTDSISIVMVDIPEIDIGPDTILITGDYYELDAGTGFDSYLWNDNSTSQTIYARETGTYWVKGSIDECYSSDTAFLFREGCDILITNMLTPNGDGIGDEIFSVNGQTVTCFEFTVFNLKGIELYKTYDVNFRWDGTLNGSILPNGIYIYLVEYYCPELMAPESKNGKIIIQR